jgi:starch-binding outer membrane protein, SusD/RagB family
MKKFLIKHFLIAAVAATVLGSCKKTFDVTPKDQLDATQMYRNVYDADAAVIGLYGKFMKLAEQYLVLNELRADMLEYTTNADQYLQQLSTHSVTEDNPYANPRPFYELIINCNDVLKNFNIMRQQTKMKDAEYLQRYADVGCLRSFVYLQLGIHYGRVPYVTDALETVDAVKDESKFPKLEFTALLDSLIQFADALAFKDQYPTGTTLNISVDGYQTQKFFINKKCLLGDLHLWKGNYEQAATYYRDVMETATTGTQGENYYSQYKIGWAGGFNHYVTYSRATDATTLVYNDGWRYMFERGQDDGFNREWVWAIPYDSKFKPENPFIKLFSPVGGSYLVKPSQEAIDNWNNQQQKSTPGSTGVPAMPGLPYDARGLLTWKMIGGQPVVMKYIYNYLNYSTNLPVNILQKSGKWFLYRQTHLHLRFAEAANRAGRHRLAWGLFNSGIAGAYPAPSDNVTDYHNTLKDTIAAFRFDARNSGATGVPYYRADWYRNIGIRNRANVTNYIVSNTSDSLIQIENGLVNESALENGYEGTRWPDLLRIAIRRNDPAFLADKIYAKLQKDGIGEAAAVKAKLMNKDNWYLPFKLQ